MENMEYLRKNGGFKNEYLIYFLLDKGEVVYVGQSTKGLNRVKQHLYEGKKQFDDFKIEKCKSDRLNDLENYYILKYRPKYNNLLNNNMVSTLYIYTKVKEKFGFVVYSINYVNEVIKNLKSNYEIYNGQIKIHKDFADKISEFMINKAEEILNKF